MTTKTLTRSNNDMMQWQWKTLLAELSQVSLHASDDSCPCNQVELDPPEYCLAKHLLNVSSLAAETAQMSPDNTDMLLELSSEAMEHHETAKEIYCEGGEWPDLAQWSREWRKKIELLYYTCGASLKQEPLDELPPLICHLNQLSPFLGGLAGGAGFGIGAAVTRWLSDRKKKGDDMSNLLSQEKGTKQARMEGNVYARAKVSGEEFEFLVDTGYSFMVGLPMSDIERLNLQYAGEGDLDILTIKGKKREHIKVYVAWLEYKAQTIPVFVMEASTPILGVLALELLRVKVNLVERQLEPVMAQFQDIDLFQMSQQAEMGQMTKEGLIQNLIVLDIRLDPLCLMCREKTMLSQAKLYAKMSKEELEVEYRKKAPQVMIDQSRQIERATLKALRKPLPVWLEEDVKASQDPLLAEIASQINPGEASLANKFTKPLPICSKSQKKKLEKCVLSVKAKVAKTGYKGKPQAICRASVGCRLGGSRRYEEKVKV